MYKFSIKSVTIKILMEVFGGQVLWIELYNFYAYTTTIDYIMVFRCSSCNKLENAVQ